MHARPFPFFGVAWAAYFAMAVPFSSKIYSSDRTGNDDNGDLRSRRLFSSVSVGNSDESRLFIVDHNGRINISSPRDPAQTTQTQPPLFSFGPSSPERPDFDRKSGTAFSFGNQTSGNSEADETFRNALFSAIEKGTEHPSTGEKQTAASISNEWERALAAAAARIAANDTDEDLNGLEKTFARAAATRAAAAPSLSEALNTAASPSQSTFGQLLAEALARKDSPTKANSDSTRASHSLFGEMLGVTPANHPMARTTKTDKASITQAEELVPKALATDRTRDDAVSLEKVFELGSRRDTSADDIKPKSQEPAGGKGERRTTPSDDASANTSSTGARARQTSKVEVDPLADLVDSTNALSLKPTALAEAEAILAKWQEQEAALASIADSVRLGRIPLEHAESISAQQQGIQAEQAAAQKLYYLWCCRVGFLSIVKGLFTLRGSELAKHVDEHGNNAYSFAAENPYNPELMRLLHEQRVSATHANHRGRTPLMQAALWGSLDHVKFFASHLPRKDFEAKDDRGCRAIDIAADPYFVRFETERDEARKSRGKELRESSDAEREQIKRVLDRYSFSVEGFKGREIRVASTGLRFRQTPVEANASGVAAGIPTSAPLDQNCTPASIQLSDQSCSQLQAARASAKSAQQGQAVKQSASATTTPTAFAYLAKDPQDPSTVGAVPINVTTNVSSQFYQRQQAFLWAQSQNKTLVSNPPYASRSQQQPASPPRARPISSPTTRPFYGSPPPIVSPPTPFHTKSASFSTNPLPRNIMYTYPTGEVDHYILQKTLIPPFGSSYKAFAVLDRGPSYDFVYAMSGYTQTGHPDVLNNAVYSQRGRDLMDSLGMIDDDFGIPAPESHVEPQLLAFLLDQHTYVSAMGTRVFYKDCNLKPRMAISKSGFCVSCSELVDRFERVYPEANVVFTFGS